MGTPSAITISPAAKMKLPKPSVMGSSCVVELPPPPRPAIAASTKAVVAIFVELSPPLAVGAVGVPVSAGEAKGAFAARSVVRLIT